MTEAWTAADPYPLAAPTATPPAAVGAPILGDGTEAVSAVADARPATPVAQSRAKPGGHLSPPTVVHGEEAAVGGPTCCRACREHRGEGVGPARRWALTEKGYAALGQVNVWIPTRAGLQEIAAQNRRPQ